MEKVLEGDVQIRNFSFGKSIDDAPNPLVKISEVGLIGLPLGERDASAIREVYADETTLVEQSSWNIPLNAVW